MKHLIVLGGGPGGYAAAFEAAKQAKRAGLELRVTLIERARLGGTCLNVGCIPTKTILRTARALHDVARLDEFAVHGVDASGAKVDVTALRERKDRVVSELVGQVEATAKRLGVEVVRGEGCLVPANPVPEVLVRDEDGGEYAHTCDGLILATGSVPLVLPALDAPGIWTSDDAVALREIPQSIIIVGGGVIGVEFASAYAAFGSKVTIVELAKSLLPGFDKRVSKTLARALKDQGVELLLGDSVQSVEKDAGEHWVARLASGKELRAAVIMSAVGRVPNVKGFGFEECGLAFEGRAVAVDESFRTNLPGVYAIGDVIGGVMLAHAAEHEGVLAARCAITELFDEDEGGYSSRPRFACQRDQIVSAPAECSELPPLILSDVDCVLQENMGHSESPPLILSDAQLIPGCVYTLPEIATVGMSVDEAKEVGWDAVAGVAKYAGNGKALAGGETEGFAQLVADKASGRLLGAQIIGAHAVELIAILRPFLVHEAKVKEIADAVFAHPTLSEVIKAAAEVTEGKM